MEKGSRNTTIRDLTIVGNHAAAGTKDALGDRQGQHGIGVYGSANTLIERVAISRVGGDCFNIKDHNKDRVLSDGVTIRDSSCRLTGRSGVIINGAQHVRITDNVFDDIGYAVFGFEPNNQYQGFERRRHPRQQHRRLQPDRPVQPQAPLCLRCALNPQALDRARRDPHGQHRGGQPRRQRHHGRAPSQDTRGDRGNRLNFTVTNNTASQAVNGPSMRFTAVKGVTVTGNKQPLAKGELATFPGSTGVTYDG